MTSSRTTVVLIVLALIVLAAVGYMVFFKGDVGSAVSSQSGALSGVETTFLNLTSRLEPVSFDTSILSDPRFQSLQNLATTVLPETSGRVNPFSPIPGAAVSQ